MTTTLSDLISRVEKLTGPDREVDAAIWEATEANQDYKSIHHYGGDLVIRYYPGPPEPTYHRLPRFTASLDAAMTLVPEGRGWVLKSVARTCEARISGEDGTPRFIGASAATPALALAAAALRARAALNDGGGG
jgi:hypothetical protein